jgi:hypothetical protein
MNVDLARRLIRAAAFQLKAGNAAASARLFSIGREMLAADKTDTAKILEDGLDREKSPDIEDEDDDEDDDEPDDEDDDVEGSFHGMPVGALPVKERRKGPRKQDIGIAKPDWWNPNSYSEA